MKLVLIALLVLATPALALAEEPTGFRDIPWGATEKALRAKVRLQECHAAGQHDFGRRTCYAKDGLKFGEILPMQVAFYFREDRLVAWQVMYNRSWRPTMGAALVERYGKPTDENREGRTWLGPRTRMTLTNYAETDFLRVVTQEEIGSHAADRKRAAEKASKGF